MATGITQEQTAQYAAFLQRHAAQITNVATPFISRLNNADREYLLVTALEHGWNTRTKLTSAKELLLWWRAALVYAAYTRKEWAVEYSTGSRIIPASQLGNEW